MRWRGRDSGPRITFRISPGRESIEGVAESLHSLVLLGRIWLEDGITFGSLSAFAMTAGGGIDVGVARHIAIRPLQAEYFLTTAPDGNNDRQNNFRYSAGVVLRFGRK